MKQISIALLGLALGACTSLRTAAPPTAQDQVAGVMAAFVAMQVEGVKAGLTEDVVAYELDLDGKPVRLGSRADVLRYAEDMFAQVRQMGAQLQLDRHALDCRTSADTAYCTVEYDFKAVMPDGSTMAQPSRSSIVLRRGADGWKWAHWHTSLSVLAASAPAAP